MNLTLSKLIGTLQSTFRIGKLTISASGLTVARIQTAQDKAGTLALTSDLTNLVPDSRTINGLPLTTDLQLAMGTGVAGTYLFCEDVKIATSPPWRELEIHSDGGAVGGHTATTTSYTEMDRYVTNAIGITTVPAGEYAFHLYVNVEGGSSPIGQMKVEVYRVNSSGTIVGSLIDVCETLPFNNITAARVEASMYLAGQPAWDATDRIGVILYGKKTSGNPATIIHFEHDVVHGWASSMECPLLSLHNNLSGLNSGNYQHLTAAQLTVVGNTSGTNSGDNATNSQYSGLVTNQTHTGDVTGSGALTIAAKAVTLAKMDDMTTASLLYRKTAGSGAPEVNTLATLKTDLTLVKADVGLSNVDNTTDSEKPVSTAQQTALDLKANLVSPSFTTPTLGTPSSGTVTNLTGTASINVNGTIGSTTPTTGAFTTLTTTAANNTTTGSGQIYLNGATGNRIDFKAIGDGAPTYTDRSLGTKIVLWPMVDASRVDYALGIGADNVWLSVPDLTQKFSWYAGNNEVASLSGTGLLTLPSGQISFPATQNASAGTTTLDDYQEANFTPVISASVGSITSYSSSSSYTKIGNLVVLSFRFTISNNGTGSGNLYMTLPFTSATNSCGTARETASTGYICSVQIGAGGSTAVIFLYSNGYPGASGRILHGTLSFGV
jgi:hypothetical protein